MLYVSCSYCHSIDFTIEGSFMTMILCYLRRDYTVHRYISTFFVQTIISSLAIINKSLNFNMYILLVKFYFLPPVELLHRVNYEEHRKIIGLIMCPLNP